MSEGKYGRLPKPKDKTRVGVQLGELSLQPTKTQHDHALEEEEEGDVTIPVEHHAEPETTAHAALRKLQEYAHHAGAMLTGDDDDGDEPWSKLGGK